MITRAEIYDYTFTYEYAHLSFAMAKPAQEPQWQSLYYPLSHQVWVALAATLLVVPIVYGAVSTTMGTTMYQQKRLSSYLFLFLDIILRVSLVLIVYRHFLYT